MLIYRLSHKDYSQNPYSGEGGHFAAGRWNLLGTLMAHASASRALAFLELAVRLRSAELRTINRLYRVTPAEIPGQLKVLEIKEADLPQAWRATPPLVETQTLGTQWMSEKRFLVISVPSAILPAERNYLINPNHPEFSRIKLLPNESLNIELRVLKRMP